MFSIFYFPQRLNILCTISFLGAEMYRDILTMCWSIKEVNKNLADRKSTSDFSIRYLKNACSVLAELMRKMSKTVPDEVLNVVDKMGSKKSITLHEVADMLYDPRKIVELNLIDNISLWAKSRMAA
jgi:hypothetical protein